VTPQTVLTLAQQALWVTALVAAPLLLTALLVALVVGLAVSILQAATQINEMTLSFIPKLLAMFAALVLAGPWMLSLLVEYVQRLFGSIPQLIG
jgi:flagellar biosynthetic protein FliQ